MFVRKVNDGIHSIAFDQLKAVDKKNVDAFYCDSTRFFADFAFSQSVVASVKETSAPLQES